MQLIHGSCMLFCYLIEHIMCVQALGMVDQSSFYGSGNEFDQYEDMRLDVDNMTYEVVAISLIVLVF